MAAVSPLGALAAEDMERAARMALERLTEALGEGDSKKARELSGIVKDMLLLSRELDSGSREVEVRFIGGAAEAAD